MSKHTTHDIDNEGVIGMDPTYCDGCGLAAEDCKCDEATADEVLDGEEDEE
jgi:Pyruvate/2-oxoacid:ferredoxin oxidoreductase delta subunit